MFGKNKISPIVKNYDGSLEIVEIFPTIQGEAIFAGRSAIFIRLTGCNLKCEFCDTEFSEKNIMSVDQIIAEVKKLAQTKIKLVVITGGEPLRQPIENLVSRLENNQFTVQIETNGTIFRDLGKKTVIICSPKIKNGKYFISDKLEKYVSAFKFIVSNQGEYKLIPKIKTTKPIYLQPMDSYNSTQNKKNLDYAISMVKKHNYTLSLQTHKIMGVK
jgi:7-carboxy-7-deazaguanine synthase